MLKQQKIKVFLGGYINVINAQNLNCRSLAKHLDKDKFEIYTMSLYSGTLSTIDGVKIFRCFRPHKLSAYLGYLWGIWSADVVYLPKGELSTWTRFLIKLLSKKSFITVEGIFDKEATKNALSLVGKNFVAHYHSFHRTFSITGFMRQYNEEQLGLKTEDRILYLGTEPAAFQGQERMLQGLNQVLMVGNDLFRKGVFDYFELASRFPEITFHLAGSGNNKVNISSELCKRGLKNFIYHGLISQQELAKLFTQVQLHVFPSRSEGFPKVTLESACAGVPSLVYSDYGAEEWITHDKNGFVVDTLDEMIEVISSLQSNQEKLGRVSKSAIELGDSFDWKEKVKDWEVVIKQLIVA